MQSEVKKIDFNGRSRARKCLIQALYSWIVTKDSMQEIVQSFFEAKNKDNVDVEYFEACLFGIGENVDDIDAEYVQYAARNLEELNAVEKSILRLATFELKFRIDVPYKVILNEAIELAKIYGAVDSHKFVNSILDKVAQEVRKFELL